MVKNMSNRLNTMFPVALILLGWVLFAIGGSISGPIWLKLALMSAARVLP